MAWMREKSRHNFTYQKVLKFHFLSSERHSQTSWLDLILMVLNPFQLCQGVWKPLCTILKQFSGIQFLSSLTNQCSSKSFPCLDFGLYFPCPDLELPKGQKRPSRRTQHDDIMLGLIICLSMHTRKIDFAWLQDVHRKGTAWVSIQMFHNV